MLFKSIRLSTFNVKSRGEIINKDSGGKNNKDNIE